MHWDATISIGNVLTALAMIAGMLLAFNRHSIAAIKLAASIEANSNATNNLAAITQKLQLAVEAQDSRLVSLETEQKIAAEVERRLGRH
jgi:hypothetical protein